ncbi:MAG: response regulator [Rufibacter sp.]
MVKKVLLIDDDEITLLLGEMVMEQNGFAREVIKLQDGKEGVDFYRLLQETAPQSAPELIFLDLNMPIMTGWEFLEEFSSNYMAAFPRTKVVIVSSSIDPRDFARSTQYDFVVDFINKPFTDEAITSLRQNQRLQGMFAR